MPNSSFASARSLAAVLVLCAGALVACGDSTNDPGDAGIDTIRPDGLTTADSVVDMGSVDAGLDTRPADAGVDQNSPDLGDAFFAADIADAYPKAVDAGVRNGCIPPPATSLCWEFGLDYSEANVKGKCEPNMAPITATCPELLNGKRIGVCVSKDPQFGTLTSIYYERADVRTSMMMCNSLNGTWFGP